MNNLDGTAEYSRLYAEAERKFELLSLVRSLNPDAIVLALKAVKKIKADSEDPNPCHGCRGFNWSRCIYCRRGFEDK